jgi:Flp pilus assembly protein TadG
MRVGTPWAEVRGPRRKAKASVEFALVLPVLMLIVLGCVDFGRFAYSYIALTNGAEVGATCASFNSYTQSTYAAWKARVRQAVTDEMQSLSGFDAGQLDVPDPQITIEADGQRRVRVEVRYPFEMVVSWPGMPARLTMRRAVVMRSVR